jgi:hypothetical protein
VPVLVAAAAFLAVSVAGTLPASAVGTPKVATLSSGALSCYVEPIGPYLNGGAGSAVDFSGKIFCNQVRELTLQVTLYYEGPDGNTKVAGEPKVTGRDTTLAAGNTGGVYKHFCEGDAVTTYFIQFTATSDVGIFIPNPSTSSTVRLACTPF